MWWFTPQKKELDPQRTYLRIEFLTPAEKTQKQATLVQLEKQFQNDEESIIPY
jgi:hypothetical protein